MNFKKYMINIENKTIVLSNLKRNTRWRKIACVNSSESSGNTLKKKYDKGKRGE